MYGNGLGVPENDAEALKWHRLAADQGHAKAQFTLGLIYAEGLGVPKNNVEAAKWFHLAADQGNSHAQAFLGLLYASGLGVKADYIQAYKWASLSAAQGYQNAIETQKLSAGRLTSAQIAEAQRLAREWQPTVTPPR